MISIELYKDKKQNERKKENKTEFHTKKIAYFSNAKSHFVFYFRIHYIMFRAFIAIIFEIRSRKLMLQSSKYR